VIVIKDVGTTIVVRNSTVGCCLVGCGCNNGCGRIRIVSDVVSDVWAPPQDFIIIIIIKVLTPEINK